MKNTILWSTLFTLIGTQVYAEPTQPVSPPPQTSGNTTPAPVPVPTPVAPVPASTAPVPATQMPTPAAQPATTTQAIPQAPGQLAPAPAVTPVINCEYKISAQTKKIDQSLVLNWSQKAVIQAFSFDPSSLDDQVQKLQPCFTEQGWTGFSSALQKSGNIEAIKSQKLMVTSTIDGQTLITEVKENQWKVIVPLAVVYQNEKEKVSQLLSVDLAVSRKINGDLGITQMIATPRGTVTTKKPEPTVTNPENMSLDTKPTDEEEPAQAPIIGKPH